MTDVWITPYALKVDIRETIIPESGTPSTGTFLPLTPGLLRWLSGKESAYQCRRCRRCGFNSWVRKISWRKWQPAPVFLPEKSHGQGILVGYSPWDCKESDTIEWMSTHGPLTLIMEQNPAGIEHQRDEAMGFLMTHRVGGSEWGGWGHGTWKTKNEFAASGWCGSSSISKQWFSFPSKPELELRHNF